MKNMKKKGFTIVELVIVIAVIAILAAVLIPTFASVIDNAKESSAGQEMSNAWKAYTAENALTFNGLDAIITTDGYYITVTAGQIDKDATDGSITIAKGTATTTDYTKLSTNPAGVATDVEIYTKTAA